MRLPFYKKIFKHSLIYFCLCLFLYNNAHSEQHTDKYAYIRLVFIQTPVAGLNESEFYADDFYFVLMDNDGKPYLPFKAFFKILNYDIQDCNSMTLECVIHSRPKGVEISWSAKSSIISVKQSNEIKKVKLGPQDYLIQNNQRWLSYRLYQKLSALITTWDASDTELSVQVNFPVYQQVKQNLQKSVEEIYQQQQAQMQVFKSNMKNLQTPPQKLIDNAELKYQLGSSIVVADSGNSADAQFSYAAMADVLGGTFQSSGTPIQYPQIHSNINWNYLHQTESGTHVFQLGDLTSYSTPFLNVLSINNGVQYQKIASNSNAQQTFTYTVRAAPGTQVSVWRNNTYLITFFTVPASGEYTVVDHDAIPNSDYRFDYFYADGTKLSKTIEFTYSQNMNLPVGGFNQSFSAGQVYLMNSTTANIYQAQVQYGLTDSITGGIGFYRLSGSNSQSFLFSDLTWQVTSQFNISYDQLLNDTGYSILGSTTYIPDNLIIWQYQNYSEDSLFLQDLNALGQVTYQHNLLVQDNLLLPFGMNWQNSYLQQFNDGMGEVQQLNSLLTNYFNRYFSPLVQVQSTLQNGERTLTYTLGNTFLINLQNTLKMTESFSPHASEQESLIYNYVTNDARLYLTVQVNRTVEQGGGISYVGSGSFNWLWKPNWQINVSINQQSSSIGFSYINVINSIFTSEDPQQFGMGYLTGKVFLKGANGENDTPLADIVINVGNQSVVTDKQGRYVISGLPTYTPLPVAIDPNSLDASLVPLNQPKLISMRPSSVMHYDIYVGQSGSVCGYIIANKTLPKTASIEVYSKDKQFKTKGDVVNFNGYYLVDHLLPGIYFIYLTGVPDPPSPEKVIISDSTLFLTHKNIYWNP